VEARAGSKQTPSPDGEPVCIPRPEGGGSCSRRHVCKTNNKFVNGVKGW